MMLTNQFDNVNKLTDHEMADCFTLGGWSLSQFLPVVQTAKDIRALQEKERAERVAKMADVMSRIDVDANDSDDDFCVCDMIEKPKYADLGTKGKGISALIRKLGTNKMTDRRATED